MATSSLTVFSISYVGPNLADYELLEAPFGWTRTSVHRLAMAAPVLSRTSG